MPSVRQVETYVSSLKINIKSVLLKNILDYILMQFRPLRFDMIGPWCRGRRDYASYSIQVKNDVYGNKNDPTK